MDSVDASLHRNGSSVVCRQLMYACCYAYSYVLMDEHAQIFTQLCTENSGNSCRVVATHLSECLHRCSAHLVGLAVRIPKHLTATTRKSLSQHICQTLSVSCDGTAFCCGKLHCCAVTGCCSMFYSCRFASTFFYQPEIHVMLELSGVPTYAGGVLGLYGYAG